MYVFDFGAPVGFRLTTRHPEWVAGLVVQNGNAYEEGLSAGARQFIALRRDVEGDEAKVRALCTLPATRGQYVGGTTDPELIAPDGWTLDQHFLDRPGRQEIQVDLAFDYHTNLALYPRWQAWLREHTPPTLITWGRGDPFFPEPGARAEGVSELLICYPVWVSERNGSTHAIASHHDHPSTALPILPSNQYRQTWHYA